jgi:transcriptional regulator with XRE-family HTH domain
MTPRINPRKEYESPINDYRIAAGLTHKELAVRAHVLCTSITALASGISSPIKGNGQLKKDAERLCEFFKVAPEDLFPRYLCSLNRSHKFEIQPYETWSERAADNCGEQFENRDLARLLLKKGMAGATPRERRILTRYIFNNETFADIARKERVTMTSVIANYKRSLRRMAKAALKLGSEIDAESCRMTVKQRFE